MNIGEVQNVNGRLTGSIATRTIDLPRIGLRKAESTSDRAPLYEILTLNVARRWVQIGALWEAASKKTGEAFLAGSVDDPGLPEPLPVALFPTEDGGYTIAWRRETLRAEFNGGFSALLSIDLMGGIKPAGKGKPQPFLRPGGNDSGALISLFMPWPTLSHAVEPGKAQAGSLRSIRASAEQQLRDFLTGHGVRLDGTERRPTWIVACGLERHLSRQSFNRMATVALNARGVSKSRRWDSIQATASISSEELKALAEHLLSAPGAIVGRCVRRHDVPQTDRRQMQRVFDFAWTRLRGYLGHRTFANLILEASRKSWYPEALCDAMLKGGFEAVLDEQMGLIGQLGDARGLEIIDQLANCILDRPSLVQFRRGRKAKLRIPVQAVTPFAGGEQRKSGKGKGGRLRSDTLRRAFNSPFWPHVLCTTSVGQEGLDFHLWCGRIARYGSLVVRRSLAGAHGAEALTEADRASPFTTMLSIARRQPSGATGLERWWLPAEGRPISVSFDWRFSLRSARRDQMLKELLNYRLALGQPDPDAFLEMLQRIGAQPQNARALAIDLSAISRRSTPV